MNFEIDWIGLSLGFVGQTVILTLALWIMLKIQAFDWNAFGLIGCAALACALDRIPFVGWEISGVVLLLCVKKLIHSRTFTDALFSVVVAYAITFAFNMFVLTAMVGDLRHSTMVRARFSNSAATSAAQPAGSTNASASTPGAHAGTATTQDPSESTPAATAPESTPAHAAAPAVHLDPDAAAGASATTAPTTATNNSATVATTTQPAPIEPYTDTNRLNALRLAGDIMKHFYVKGVSQGATISIAMISNGTRNFDILAGDIVQLQTSDGRYVAVKCESVGDDQVIVSVEGVKVTLFHR
jgi:hypothetical protein